MMRLCDTTGQFRERGILDKNENILLFPNRLLNLAKKWTIILYRQRLSNYRTLYLLKLKLGL